MKLPHFIAFASVITASISTGSAGEMDIGAQIEALKNIGQVTMMEVELRQLHEIKRRAERNLTDTEQAEYSTLVENIRTEKRKHAEVFEQIRESANMRDYPGLLGKLRIVYELNFTVKDSKSYFMYFLSGAHAEGDPVLFIQVDLDGKIIRKVKDRLTL